MASAVLRELRRPQRPAVASQAQAPGGVELFFDRLHERGDSVGPCAAEREIALEHAREHSLHATGDRERRDRRDLRPRRAGGAAEHPERDRADLRVVRIEHQQADHRAGERVHRDAGEDQGDDLGAAAGSGRGVDERDRDQAADERGER